MYVGIVTTAFFGFLLFCTLALFALLLEDRWREARKARFGKHQKALASELNTEIVDFFGISMTDEERRQEKECQEQFVRNQNRQQEKAIEALRAKLARNDETVIAAAGWDQTHPVDDYQEGTVSYPAFNMKGETIDPRGAHKA